MNKANIGVLEIGRVVRVHRDKAGLSRRALAEVAGVSESAIYSVEAGTPGVRLETLLKLFAVLNIRLRLEGPFAQEAVQAAEPDEADHA